MAVKPEQRDKPVSEEDVLKDMRAFEDSRPKEREDPLLTCFRYGKMLANKEGHPVFSQIEVADEQDGKWSLAIAQTTAVKVPPKWNELPTNDKLTLDIDARGTNKWVIQGTTVPLIPEDVIHTFTIGQGRPPEEWLAKLMGPIGGNTPNHFRNILQRYWAKSGSMRVMFQESLEIRKVPNQPLVVELSKRLMTDEPRTTVAKHAALLLGDWKAGLGEEYLIPTGTEDGGERLTLAEQIRQLANRGIEGKQPIVEDTTSAWGSPLVGGSPNTEWAEPLIGGIPTIHEIAITLMNLRYIMPPM